MRKLRVDSHRDRFEYKEESIRYLDLTEELNLLEGWEAYFLIDKTSWLAFRVFLKRKIQ